MKALNDKIIVAVEKPYNDEIEISDGTKLYLDVAFQETKHRRQYGEVLAVPEKLSQTPYIYKHIGMPRYNYPRLHPSHPNPNAVSEIRHSDIADITKDLVGRTVYFNYKAIDEGNIAEYLGADYLGENNGRMVISLPISIGIYAYQNDAGAIVPIAGHLLCTQPREDKSHLISPAGVITDLDYLSDGKPQQNRLVVDKVCRPFLCDQRTGVYPGDTVIAETNKTYIEVIGGIEYHIVLYRNVLANLSSK